MRIARYLAVVVLGALLTACGASGHAYRIEVLIAVAGNGYHGYAEQDGSRWVLKVDPEFSYTLGYTERVIAHELGHCRGLGHRDEQGCLMQREIGLFRLCADDAERAVGYGPASRIVVLDESLRQYVVLAAEFWNEAVGSVIFEVLPARAD